MIKNEHRLRGYCFILLFIFSIFATNVNAIEPSRMKVIINRDNPVEVFFSAAELKDLFFDMRYRWPNRSNIVIVTFPAKDRRARVFFSDFFGRLPNYGDIASSNRNYSKIHIVRSFEEMIQTVGGEQNAIGYLPSDLVIFIEDNVQYINYVEKR